MSSPETFGAWLKRERKKRGLTQEALGALVSYGVWQIRKIEIDKRRFGEEQAQQLAALFDVPPHEVKGFVAWARGESSPPSYLFPPLTEDEHTPPEEPIPVPSLKELLVPASEPDGANPPPRPAKRRLPHRAGSVWVCVSLFASVLLLGAVAIAYHEGRSAATGRVVPGGRWLSPDPSFVLRSDTVHFAARAYPSHTGDPPIAYVNFTATWGTPDGDWHLACQVTTPAPGTTDRYECDWPLASAGVPNGPMKVSFDVYDAKGNFNLAPNGVHAGTLQQ